MRSVGIALRVQSLICLCHVILMHPHQKYFSSVNEKWGLEDSYCNLVPYCTEHDLGTGSISNHLAASQKCPMPDLLHQVNKILRCFVSTLKLQPSSSPLTFQPFTFFFLHWILSSNDSGEAQPREGSWADIDVQGSQAVHVSYACCWSM